MNTRPDIQGQVDTFHSWASKQLADGLADRTIDELFDEWRIENPTESELEESVAAIRRGLDQAGRGEGKPLEAFERDFRSRHKLPPEA